MTSPIRSLKFEGRPMRPVPGGFFIAFTVLGAPGTLRIKRATPSIWCHWIVKVGPRTVAVFAASGEIAARNAAQRWIRDNAPLAFARDSAKGRAA